MSKHDIGIVGKWLVVNNKHTNSTRICLSNIDAYWRDLDKLYFLINGQKLHIVFEERDIHMDYGGGESYSTAVDTCGLARHIKQTLDDYFELHLKTPSDL